MNNQIILSQEIKADLNRNDINIFDMIRKHKFIIRQKNFNL